MHQVRNKEMLINFIKTHSLNSAVTIRYSQYSLHHLIALGGWKRSFEMLQERKKAENSNAERIFAWHFFDAIVNALSIAKHFGHPKLQNDLTRFVRRDKNIYYYKSYYAYQTLQTTGNRKS